MKPPADITIHIPAAIMAMPDLNLIERAILTRIHERPACSNNSLATLTGLSERGIESTLARLKKLGLIHSRGHGQSRKLFLVERHIECGKNENENSHVKCGRDQIENAHTECGSSANAECHTNGGIQPEPLTNEIPLDTTNTKFLAKELDALLLCLLAGTFSQARKHLASARQWYSVVCQRIPEMQAHADECLRVQDDRIFILEAGWSGLSTSTTYERNRLISLLFEASPERLKELRSRVEASTARGKQLDLMRLIGG